MATGSEKTAIADLIFALIVWAVTGVSYKVFESIGVTLAVYFVITRLFKVLAVGAILQVKQKKPEPIRNAKELGLIAINAVFSVANPVFFFLSLSYTSISNAYFLTYTMPAWVLVFAVLFLKESISLKKITGLLLTIIGVAAIAHPEGILSHGAGFVFPLLAALSFSGDVITARALKDYSHTTVALYTNTFQFLLFLPAIFIFGMPQIENFGLGLFTLALTGNALGIASYAYYFALEKIEASKAAVVTLLELVFASGLAFLFFGELPTGVELFGYVIMLEAMLILVLRRIDITNFERLIYLNRKP